MATFAHRVAFVRPTAPFGQAHWSNSRGPYACS